MLDKARQLLTASKRSDVPPFMVMDVIAAAARIEAAGGRVIHMEVGQPAAPRAARPRSRRRNARFRRPSCGYTEALGSVRCGSESRGIMHETYGVALDPSRVIVTTGSSAGFVLAFLAMFEAGDRVGSPIPATRRTGISLRRWAASRC